jgi:hypothetical protein
MRIHGITPQRTIDEQVFLLPAAPNPPESLQLFCDGILQEPGKQFGLIGDQIIFKFEVKVSDRLRAWFETESR